MLQLSRLLLQKVGRFLRSTALGRLGFSQAEFEHLMSDVGPGVKLCSALEERAKKMNIIIDDVRSHVTSLEDQSESACHAHFEWKPPEVCIFRM